MSDTAVCLSVPWCSCLGYRHAGCLQLSHCRPPEMCGPVSDERRSAVMFATIELAAGRAGVISSRRPLGDTLLLQHLWCVDVCVLDPE